MEETFISLSDQILNKQLSNGTFSQGINGPWKHKMTPVRNTAHLISTMSFAYRITPQEKYLLSLEKGLSYLEIVIKDNILPLLRNSSSLKTNGLVGQAWIIEALINAYIVTGREDLLGVSKEIILKHPFNRKRGLWHNVEVDGSDFGICKTINQQLFFAGIICYLIYTSNSKDLQLMEMIEIFLFNLKDNINIKKGGLIDHTVKGNSTCEVLKKTINDYKNRKLNDKLANGYHSFNLHGISLVKAFSKESSSYWKENEELIKKIYNYTKSDIFLSKLEGNPYIFHYNLTGFEINNFKSHFNEFFEEHNNHIKNWEELQIENTIYKNRIFSSVDPDTLICRQYEYFYQKSYT